MSSRTVNARSAGTRPRETPDAAATFL
jgi:hypothetical protein